MVRLKDSVKLLEGRDEGKGSQTKAINIVVVSRIAPRKNELFVDKYDTKAAFEFFGDCASILHRS
ncbi:hypothetical protein BS47DRAFT_1350306 [Hydnum rufescens UP504]|uniref:Uncharacterized protein n=1 Tax=Hydnum rufescens UP504 TaxID=1448309 RepID=A0A9P6AM97_9AGAM|nr:hypothetical protein BS47DRAFT_1350306 [Hydnum rufescens UP504]